MEDRQSRIAWEMINEVSRRNSTVKAKLKQHFQSLLRKQPKVTHKPIMRIIRKQFDIKLGQFTFENSTEYLKKLKI